MTTKPAHGAITLTNVRPLKPGNAPPNLVYIGPRRAGWPRSPLAMPYPLRGNTPATLAEYRRWLWQQIQAEDRPVLAELRRIAGLARQGDVLLGCWGAPAQGYGQVVKAAVAWILARLARPVKVGDRVCFTNVRGEKRYGQVLGVSEQSGLIEVQWRRPEERGWTHPPGDARRQGSRLEIVEARP